ncbi:MAG: transposase [Coprobacillus cateniformis]|nr:transposase [Coprobacillus cateniformis]
MIFMSKRKPKKDSMINIINKFSNNEQACVDFFFNVKCPTGFYCEKCGCTHFYSIKRGHVFECAKCGHQHYLFSGTIFQDNKLPLFKLILGLYLFFSANKAYSAIEMANQLDLNYKTALKFCQKCRVLMTLSNSERILDSLFYEADTLYIGSKTSSKPRNGY